MTVRSQLIRWALRLQFPPFLWLFRAYYGLAIGLCRFAVSRVEGVKSIYLSGSWARGEVIYGLSDIDFKVFVAGDKNQKTYDTIRRRFSFLRRFFPMLGPTDEKGIYFLATFDADYRHHPLVQHLFDARFFKHRLLWGDDLIDSLPLKPWNELDQGECVFARLKDWIERIHVLADCAALCPEQQRHLFFKAVSDVALLALRIDSPEFLFSQRAEILQRLAPDVEEPHRRLIENLIRENRALYRIRLNSVEEDFDLFKRMVAYCAEIVSRQDRSPMLPWDVEPPAALSEPEHVSVADALRGFSPLIRQVRVFQWPQLPLNPFDLCLFPAPVYLLDCSRPLELGVFQEVKKFCRTNLKNEAVVLLRENPWFLSSVDAELVEHWGSFPGSSDLLHLLHWGTPSAGR